MFGSCFEPTNQRMVNYKHQQEKEREDGSNNEEKGMNRQKEKANRKRTRKRQNREMKS